jgi:hypothetical protein
MIYDSINNKNVAPLRYYGPTCDLTDARDMSPTDRCAPHNSRAGMLPTPERFAMSPFSHLAPLFTGMFVVKTLGTQCLNTFRGASSSGNDVHHYIIDRNLLEWILITVAARPESWTVFTLSNTGIIGSNPTRCMSVCLYCFCACVILCT